MVGEDEPKNGADQHPSRKGTPRYARNVPEMLFYSAGRNVFHRQKGSNPKKPTPFRFLRPESTGRMFAGSQGLVFKHRPARDRVAIERTSRIDLDFFAS